MEKITDITSQQESEEKNPNNSEYGNMKKNVMTYERKPLDGTPFIIHKSETHGWAAGIAEHKLTGWYPTEEILKKVLKGINNKGIDWDLITGTILILIEKVLEKKEIEKTIIKKEN